MVSLVLLIVLHSGYTLQERLSKPFKLVFQTYSSVTDDYIGHMLSECSGRIFLAVTIRY